MFLKVIFCISLTVVGTTPLRAECSDAVAAFLKKFGHLLNVEDSALGKDITRKELGELANILDERFPQLIPTSDAHEGSPRSWAEAYQLYRDDFAEYVKLRFSAFSEMSYGTMVQVGIDPSSDEASFLRAIDWLSAETRSEEVLDELVPFLVERLIRTAFDPIEVHAAGEIAPEFVDPLFPDRKVRYLDSKFRRFLIDRGLFPATGEDELPVTRGNYARSRMFAEDSRLARPIDGTAGQVSSPGPK